MADDASGRNMPKQQRYYWLDWLRFLAAFAVLLAHTRGVHWAAWENIESVYKTRAAWAFFAVTRLGLEAVAVFFILSGFLVGGKILERVQKGAFDAKAYAADRVTRIYVPLIPALVLTAIVNWKIGWSVSVSEFLGNIFALQGVFCNSFGGNAPLWSLSYEIWFYWLAGFAALIFVPQKRTVLVAVVAVTLALAIFTKLNAALLFCWCLGAISYRLLPRNLGWISFLIGATLVFAGCAFSQLASDSISVKTKTALPFAVTQDGALLILSLGLCAVVPFLARRPPRSRALVSLEKAGTPLAGFSYTLYLTHFVVLQFWHFYVPERSVALSASAFLMFLVKVASCCVAAWLLYLPFEAQTERVRNWLRNGFPGRTVGPSVKEPLRRRA